MLLDFHFKCFFNSKSDWHNDAENSILITRINSILKYIKIENSLHCNNISQYYSFAIFDQINAALVRTRDFFQKHQNISFLPNFLK